MQGYSPSTSAGYACYDVGQNYGDTQADDEKTFRARLCILGSRMTGKSTLAQSLNKTTCPYASFPPPNSNYVAHYKKEMASGEVVEAVITDRNYPGDSQMTDQTFSMIIKDCDGVIIMADQRNPASVDQAVAVAQKCIKYKSSALRMILWNFDDVYCENIVSDQQLGAAAAASRALHFKISAKEGFGVDDAMLMFADKLIDGGQKQIDKYGYVTYYDKLVKPSVQPPKSHKTEAKKCIVM